MTLIGLEDKVCHTLLAKSNKGSAYYRKAMRGPNRNESKAAIQKKKLDLMREKYVIED